mgnify:CR=1 FL=1|jgi:hypothetical protein
MNDLIQLGRSEPLIEKSSRLVIAVHPYPFMYRTGDERSDWQKKMDGFFASTEDPVISLISTFVNDEDLGHIRNLQPAGPRYFIPTYNSYPEPFIGWGPFVSHLFEFQSNEHIIVGTYLGPENTNCVGTTYKELLGRIQNVRIDENLVERIN